MKSSGEKRFFSIFQKFLETSSSSEFCGERERYDRLIVCVAGCVCDGTFIVVVSNEIFFIERERGKFIFITTALY